VTHSSTLAFVKIFVKVHFLRNHESYSDSVNMFIIKIGNHFKRADYPEINYDTGMPLFDINYFGIHFKLEIFVQF